MDALSSAAALTIEGFEPRARGREGNYRKFVAQLHRVRQSDPERTDEAIWNAVLAEKKIRKEISKPDRDLIELSAEEAACNLIRYTASYSGIS